MNNLWKNIKNPLLTAVFVLLGLFLYTNFAYALPFGRPPVTNKDALFTANGTAEVTYVPDTALLYLSVNKTATTQTDAKNEANKVINQITAELKKLGVEEKNIKTTNFSVSQDYSYDVMPLSDTVATGDKMTILPQRPTKSRGYAANVSMEVRVKPIGKAEAVIDAVTKAGATQVGTSQLILDEKEQKELENQARVDAIKDAKEKAKSLADAAGIRLGRVVDIQENGGGYPQPMMYRTAELKMDSSAGQAVPPTEINPGENKISVSITLSYETY